MEGGRVLEIGNETREEPRESRAVGAMARLHLVATPDMGGQCRRGLALGRMVCNALSADIRGRAAGLAEAVGDGRRAQEDDKRDARRQR